MEATRQRHGLDEHEALTFGPLEHDPNGLNQHAPGAKLDAGKIRPTLILNSMHRAIRAVVEVGEYGATKYTKDGWQYVDGGFERYTDAMHRHLIAENDALHDPQTGLTHAAHVAWNALARLELLLREIEARGEQ